MSGLKLWQESINEYCSKSGESYHVPKKNTKQYIEIRKKYIYMTQKRMVKMNQKLKRNVLNVNFVDVVVVTQSLRNNL